MSNITKLCANHLRTFFNNYGAQLKSGHAHELVAAFFGYKSRAAMLADSLFPIENLNKAQILVLMPSSFIDERRKLLDGLSSELLDTGLLGEEMLVYLASIGQFSGRSFATWGSLAETLTNEYLQKNSKVILPGSYAKQYLFNKPLYEFSPKMEMTSKGVKLTVENTYYDPDFQALDLKLSIELLRISRKIGYSIAEISLINCSLRADQMTGIEGNNFLSPDLQKNFDQVNPSIDIFKENFDQINQHIKQLETYLASKCEVSIEDNDPGHYYEDIVMDGDIVICAISEDLSWNIQNKRIIYLRRYFPIGTEEDLVDFLDEKCVITEADWLPDKDHKKYLSETSIDVQKKMFPYLKDLLVKIASKCDPNFILQESLKEEEDLIDLLKKLN